MPLAKPTQAIKRRLLIPSGSHTTTHKMRLDAMACTPAGSNKLTPKTQKLLHFRHTSLPVAGTKLQWPANDSSPDPCSTFKTESLHRPRSVQHLRHDGPNQLAPDERAHISDEKVICQMKGGGAMKPYLQGVATPCSGSSAPCSRPTSSA